MVSDTEWPPQAAEPFSQEEELKEERNFQFPTSTDTSTNIKKAAVSPTAFFMPTPPATTIATTPPSPQPTPQPPANRQHGHRDNNFHDKHLRIHGWKFKI